MEKALGVGWLTDYQWHWRRHLWKSTRGLGPMLSQTEFHMRRRGAENGVLDSGDLVDFLEENRYFAEVAHRARLLSKARFTHPESIKSDRVRKLMRQHVFFGSWTRKQTCAEEYKRSLHDTLAPFKACKAVSRHLR